MSYDDESSGSLERHTGWESEWGREGGKIVKPGKVKGGLSREEIRRGVWFEAGVMEYWTRESEASFPTKRWRLFGTRIL